MSLPSPEPEAGATDCAERPDDASVDEWPVALSIAGSDSGGGAGIQADLAAFAYFQVFGTTAVTAVTAQNPHDVTAIQAIDADTIAAQIAAVFTAFTVKAVKTGMLFDADIIDAAAAALRARPGTALVVDPVMVATSGARLLRDAAARRLRDALLPLAAVITPNLPEAEILSGRPLDGAAAIRTAARELAREFNAVVMIKGGHAAGGTAVDTVSDGRRLWEMSAPRVSAPGTHGTGCSLSAAAAACLALGTDIPTALHRAKAYVLGRLLRPVRVGPHTWGMAPPADLPLAQIRIREE
jgi:hydroxymethylpyrimidine/phosphomethylpyrimidine kinase